MLTLSRKLLLDENAFYLPEINFLMEQIKTLIFEQNKIFLAVGIKVAMQHLKLIFRILRQLQNSVENHHQETHYINANNAIRRLISIFIHLIP